MSESRCSVAVVGSGLAGLVTAYLLETLDFTDRFGNQVRFNVHLIEKSESLGMDSSSVTVKLPEGSFRIDTPMRSINGGSHNRVGSLYRHLRIQLIRSNFSYSFSRMSSCTPRSPSSAPPSPVALPNSGVRGSRSDSSDSLDGVSTLPLLPPPPYCLGNTMDKAILNGDVETEEGARRSGKVWSRRSHEAVKDAMVQPRPAQTTLFLYEGSNGIKWPPLSIPSHVKTSGSKLMHLLHITLLALSYLHLLLLAFFYVYTGLAAAANERTRAGPWHGLKSNSRYQSLPVHLVYLLVGGLLPLANVASEDLESWCRRHWIWKEMQKEVLEPLYAAVSTVGRKEVGKLPVGEILEYIVSTFGSSHYVTKNGVQEVVARLSAPYSPERIHLSSNIVGISPTSSSNVFDNNSQSVDKAGRKAVKIIFEERKNCDVTMTRELEFDHVVLATQANQAQSLLRMFINGDGSRVGDARHSASEERDERLEALGSFTYIQTKVVNHWDESILPVNLSDRRDLNLTTFSDSAVAEVRLGQEAGEEDKSAEVDDNSSAGESSETIGDRQASGATVPRSSVQATHILSRTHTCLSKSLPTQFELLQTTNPIVEIDKDKVITETWYERAVVCKGSKKVLPRFILEDAASCHTHSSSGGQAVAKKGDEKREAAMGDLQGLDNLWFVGSWCANGIPLLEGCVTSAERAVAAIAHKEGLKMPMLPY